MENKIIKWAMVSFALLLAVGMVVMSVVSIMQHNMLGPMTFIFMGFFCCCFAVTIYRDFEGREEKHGYYRK